MYFLFIIPVLALLAALGIWLFDLTKAFRYQRKIKLNLDPAIGMELQSEDGFVVYDLLITLGTLLALAFWIGTAWVAVHFIHRYW